MPTSSSGPRITAGPKQRLLVANADQRPWYINDHTLVQGPDGAWHVFGIWHAEPADPLDETFFLHASTDGPLVPSELVEDGRTSPTWTVHDPVLAARTELGETHVWAPHVVALDDGTYLMAYASGTADHERYRITLATSDDLCSWHHGPNSQVLVDGYDARDPMLLAHQGRWLLYYTRTSRPDGGTHQVAFVESDDLVHWTQPEVAFDSGVVGTFGGPTESPFVIADPVRPGGWLLFVCESTLYDRTLVYASDDPRHFSPDGLVEVDLDEHCAEVVHDQGRWYLTGGGWGRGGLTIRPLVFG